MRVRSSHGPLPLNERGVFNYVTSFGILANSINLLSCISLGSMNYKDALSVSISDKMTKAPLIAVANALQDRCLLNELDKPELISPKLYIKDIRARWDIHLIEWRAITKDIVNLGRNTRKVLVTAMNNMD